MAHVRHQLRSAIVTAVTGLTTTGDRIYTGRVYPRQTTEVPSLTVNVVDEAAEVVSIHLNGLVQRTVTVEVVGHARGTLGLAAALDVIAEEVETAIGGAITVSGHSVPMQYTGCSIEFAGEVDQPAGQVRMTWTADLYTAANAPGTLAQA